MRPKYHQSFKNEPSVGKTSMDHSNMNKLIRSITKFNNNNSIQNGTSDNYKFRKDVWREVDLVSEHDESPKNLLHLNECKAIKFRMALNNSERQRRAKISTDLQERQSQWDTELEQRLQQIRIDSAEKQKRSLAKRLEREKEAMKAIERIEAQAKQDEMKTNAKKSEMIEHSRKLIEHANQLKRQDEIRLLIENINSSKVLFINLFELYAKTIINFQQLLNQTGKLTEYTMKRDSLLKRYENLINLINSKAITMAETELFENLCSDIKPAIATVNKAGTKERIDQYYALMNYYEEYRAQIQPLIADVNMKKFRFSCQKGVNTPVNSISAVSVQHLQDKFDKILDLLSGKQVRAGDVQFTASEHPLGIKYCTLLLAKKFITQGTTVTSSHASAAFPIAAVIVSIWQLMEG